MPFAVHHGLKFHVQELGSKAEGPRADDSPVIMVHGLLVGSMASWYFTVAPALAVRHRVLLYDLRGHGMSERARSGYDVMTMAGDLASIADSFASGPITLVGHSYGAVVALRFALKHPERVKKLVLVEAPMPPSRLDELDGFLGKPAEQMAESLPGALREALARKGRQATRFVDGLRFLATESTLFADLRSAEDVPDDALAALRCPVLCVYGTESSCRPVGDRLARVIPGARLVVLQGGHFLPVEAPRALGECITEFLDG
jgi:pimeloyl-ACP methyl ester carboxylesterase